MKGLPFIAVALVVSLSSCTTVKPASTASSAASGPVDDAFLADSVRHPEGGLLPVVYAQIRDAPSEPPYINGIAFLNSAGLEEIWGGLAKARDHEVYLFLGGPVSKPEDPELRKLLVRPMPGLPEGSTAPKIEGGPKLAFRIPPGANNDLLARILNDCGGLHLKGEDIGFNYS